LSKRDILSSPYYLLKKGVFYKISGNKTRRNVLINDILRVYLVVSHSSHADILASSHGDISVAHFTIDRFLRD
jgi:hypothetical protein